jgi:hypothetical protein
MYPQQRHVMWYYLELYILANKKLRSRNIYVVPNQSRTEEVGTTRRATPSVVRRRTIPTRFDSTKIQRIGGECGQTHTYEDIYLYIYIYVTAKTQFTPPCTRAVSSSSYWIDSCYHHPYYYYYYYYYFGGNKWMHGPPIVMRLVVVVVVVVIGGVSMSIGNCDYHPTS